MSVRDWVARRGASGGLEMRESLEGYGEEGLVRELPMR
jgi:hypothetical protein